MPKFEVGDTAVIHATITGVWDDGERVTVELPWTLHKETTISSAIFDVIKGAPKPGRRALRDKPD